MTEKKKKTTKKATKKKVTKKKVAKKEIVVTPDKVTAKVEVAPGVKLETSTSTQSLWDKIKAFFKKFL